MTPTARQAALLALCADLYRAAVSAAEAIEDADERAAELRALDRLRLRFFDLGGSAD